MGMNETLLCMHNCDIHVLSKIVVFADGALLNYDNLWLIVQHTDIAKRFKVGLGLGLSMYKVQSKME